MEFINCLSMCDESAILILLSEAADGLGRIYKDDFVKLVAQIIKTAEVGAVGFDARHEDRLISRVASFAAQLFDVLENALFQTGHGSGERGCVFFTFMAAAMLGFTRASPATRWHLPFLLFDPDETGYIHVGHLQEYLFATSLATEVLDSTVARQAKEVSLSAKRKVLGYRPVSPASASLLPPSKRTDAILSAIHSSTITATQPRVHAIESSRPHIDDPVSPMAVGVAGLKPARAVAIMAEAKVLSHSIVEDCRYSRFGVEMGPEDVIEDLTIPSGVKLSSSAYRTWVGHNFDTH